jgi:hypothetical protein
MSRECFSCVLDHVFHDIGVAHGCHIGEERGTIELVWLYTQNMSHCGSLQDRKVYSLRMPVAKKRRGDDGLAESLPISISIRNANGTYSHATTIRERSAWKWKMWRQTSHFRRHTVEYAPQVLLRGWRTPTIRFVVFQE